MSVVGDVEVDAPALTLSVAAVARVQASTLAGQVHVAVAVNVQVHVDDHHYLHEDVESR